MTILDCCISLEMIKKNLVALGFVASVKCRDGLIPVLRKC